MKFEKLGANVKFQKLAAPNSRVTRREAQKPQFRSSTLFNTSALCAMTSLAGAIVCTDAAAQTFVIAPGSATGNTVLFPDGATAPNSSDQVRDVTYTVTGTNEITVTYDWFPALTGSYTGDNGIHTKLFYYDGSGWSEIFSNRVTAANLAGRFNNWQTETYVFNIPSPSAGVRYVRASIIDLADGSDSLNQTRGCGACGTASATGRHFDNADVSFTIAPEDTTPPTLAIVGPVATQTSAFTVNFNFSEDVVGFDASDVVVSNANLSNFSGSGANYSATLTPFTNATISVNVAAATYEDVAGNDNTGASSFSVQADITRPGASVGGPAGPVNAPFVANFNFSESVSNFVVADLQLINATAAGFTGSGASYSATITPTADGLVSVTIPNGVANDAATNTNTVSPTFTVVADFTAPVVTVPADIVVGNAPGLTAASVTYSVSANDPGNGALTPVQTAGLASGASFPLGTTSVSFQATDAAGNVGAASFNVTVNDTEAPVIVSLPADISVNTDAGQPTAIVSWTAPTVTDNAPGASITQTAGSAPGSAFPIGVTTITYEAQDSAGNTVSDSFTVTVADAEPPALTGFPTNIAINVDYPTTSAVASWVAPGVTDNAPGATVTRIAGPASGSSFPLGVTTITYRAQDAAGGFVDQSFTVTVSQTPPGSVRLVIRSGEDGAFAFSSPEPGFNFTINTVNGDGDATIAIRPGVFNLAFALPAGFGILSADCDDTNSTLDGDAQTGAVNVSSSELVTCTIVTVDSLTETSRLIGAFVGARAALIMQNMPDADRRIDRLNGRASSPGGVSAFGLNIGRGDLPFNFSLGQDRANFSFSLAGMRAQRAQTSSENRAARARWGDGQVDADWIAQVQSADFGDFDFSTDSMDDLSSLAASAAGGSANRSDVANREGARAVGGIADSGDHRFDLWMEGAYAQFDTSVGEGDFYMLSAGADWIANTDLLLGLGLQVDWTDMSGPLANSSISGTGFLVGPYMTARLRDGLYFDGQLSVGQSFNQVSPFGIYEDDVDAERMFTSAALIGDIREGPWTFRPEGRVSYFREETEAYIDSLSVAIPSVAIETGTAEFSPMVRYRRVLESGSTLEPFVTLESIWTFSQKNTAAFALSSDSFIDEGVRGRLETGFDFVQPGGMSVHAVSFYDGIGEDDFSSWGAQLRFSWTFEVE